MKASPSSTRRPTVAARFDRACSTGFARRPTSRSAASRSIPPSGVRSKRSTPTSHSTGARLSRRPSHPPTPTNGASGAARSAPRNMPPRLKPSRKTRRRMRRLQGTAGPRRPRSTSRMERCRQPPCRRGRPRRAAMRTVSGGADAEARAGALPRLPQRRRPPASLPETDASRRGLCSASASPRRS